MKIGIIGAGWYGCHIALESKKAGHAVTLFEKSSDIMQGISGNFGIRLHKGPHYPRSKATRESCISSFKQFCDTYPELIVAHKESLYALGTIDAMGNPPKVDLETFSKVCNESPECTELDPQELGFNDLQTIMSLEEPSIVLGKKLRNIMRAKLKKAGVRIHYNYKIEEIRRLDEVTQLKGLKGTVDDFDYVVNATSYQSLIPQSIKKEFPIPMEVVYQPCLALRYRDKTPGEKPISFIVMDGWFPCLMPTVTKDNQVDEYIMTHGSYTIMGSCQTVKEAHAILAQIDNKFIDKHTRPDCEREMNRFWPAFQDRFEYLGHISTVIAKLNTKTEFRSAVTFEHKGIIYALPGKVSNIFNAAKEVLALIEDNKCIQQKNFRYMEHGVLHEARKEIAEKSRKGEQSTCNLNTFKELKLSFWQSIKQYCPLPPEPQTPSLK